MFSRAAIAAAILAFVASASPLPVEVEDRAQHCYSGVYMIVGRGSNEPAGEGPPSPISLNLTFTLTALQQASPAPSQRS